MASYQGPLIYEAPARLTVKISPLLAIFENINEILQKTGVPIVKASVTCSIGKPKLVRNVQKLYCATLFVMHYPLVLCFTELLVW